MKSLEVKKLRKILRADCCSSKGFLVRAGLISVFFLIVHALGFREHTTFLTGTPADAHTSLNQTTLFGVVYLVAYFGFVIGTPILVLGAAIFSLLDVRLSKVAATPIGKLD